MVGLVVGSILVGVILQFVLGQSRFAATQTGREEVQQNLRGALEVVASDLRGTLIRGIERADAQALEFALPVMWGVVCRIEAGATTIVFPDLGITTPPSGAGIGLMMRDTASAAPWQPIQPAARATVTGVQARPLDETPGCGTLQPAGPAVAFRFTGANHPAVTPGSRAALYQQVRYEVRTVGSEQWIYRSNGMTGGSFNMEPLAGPVRADSTGFQYLASVAPAAPALIAPPGTGAPTANIRLVRFTVQTLSRQHTGPSQTRRDSVTVQIRN